MPVIIKGHDDLAHTYILKRFDHCIIVDPGGNYKQIMQHIDGYKVSYILLTHAHVDHMELIHLFECPIYMHKDDYLLLTNDDNNGFKDLRLTRKFHPTNLDIRFVKDGDLIPFVDQTVEVIHTPGHTKGSLCFLYKSELYTGDTLFKSGVGRTDLLGGSNILLTKSIKKLFKQVKDNTKVYPGHDQATSIKEEKKENKYVKQILSK